MDDQKLLNEYPYKDFTYKIKWDSENGINSFLIEHNKGNPPEQLCKYYKLLPYSIDALEKGYLFASHPIQFNDAMDSDPDLIDYSKFEFTDYKRYLIDITHYYSDEIVLKDLYDNSKILLQGQVSQIIPFYLYHNFGIISLCGSYDNVTMWSYYTDNAGFQIRFKTDLLLNEIGYKPNPINYVDKLEKIDAKKYQMPVCINYHSNVKHNKWENENEWRIITIDKMGNYHPNYNPKNIDSRKKYYSKECINDIILGYGFFHYKEIIKKKTDPKYNIVSFKSGKKLKKRLLNFIIDNNIECNFILKDTLNLQLIIKPIKIEKLSANRFKIYKLWI